VLAASPPLLTPLELVLLLPQASELSRTAFDKLIIDLWLRLLKQAM
jgi:hypothetical protein